MDNSSRISRGVRAPSLLGRNPIVRDRPTCGRGRFDNTVTGNTRDVVDAFSLNSALTSNIDSTRTLRDRGSRTFRDALNQNFSSKMDRSRTCSELSGIKHGISSRGATRDRLVGRRTGGFVSGFRISSDRSSTIGNTFTVRTVNALSISRTTSVLVPVINGTETTVGTTTNIGSGDATLIPTNNGNRSNNNDSILSVGTRTGKTARSSARSSSD